MQMLPSEIEEHVWSMYRTTEHYGLMMARLKKRLWKDVHASIECDVDKDCALWSACLKETTRVSIDAYQHASFDDHGHLVLEWYGPIVYWALDNQ